MRTQTPIEEKFNALSHGLGIVLGFIGLFLLINSENQKTGWGFASKIIYGFTIILLFSASTLYHALKNEKYKHYGRIFDHIGIYILIAGTYTPVCIITLEDSLGWTLLYLVWGIALAGTILKVFFTGRLQILSTLLYLVMGWLIVFDFNYLSQNLQLEGLWWLFGGGLAYTLGIVFYIVERIPYNHVIWHLCVLIGAICHFFMIYLYVI